VRGKSLVLISVAWVLIAPSRSFAIDANTDNIGLGIALLIPSFWAQIALHEGSHAIMMTALGGRVARFHILPSYQGDKMYLGYTDVKWPAPPTATQLAMVSLAPQMTNVLLFTTTEMLFYYDIIPPDSRLAPLFFVFGELAPWIDFTFTVVIYDSTDMRNLQERSGVSRGVSRSVGAAISAVGAYFLIKRGYSVFSKRWRPAKIAAKTAPRYKIFLQEGPSIALAVQF